MTTNNLKIFWQKLANGKYILVIYKTNYYKLIKLPNGKKNKNYKIIELNDNKNIKALITSAQSWDSYESLEKKVNKSNLKNVILNYKKNFSKYNDFLHNKNNELIKIDKIYSI
jgi:hypothetical protein